MFSAPTRDSMGSSALPLGLHWLDDVSGVDAAASEGGGWVSGWRSDSAGTGLYHFYTRGSESAASEML